ncbi:hypothetical protein BDB01DRAFT_892772 [Pilobolus umbonatus]|nr:hypothetical protein BDB01DRAFT_892772 [Pilobolus umbonatus]
MALRDNSQIVQINLSDLPILEVFGDIIDIDPHFDKKNEMYLGTGYVVLDLWDNDGEIAFQPLHGVSWMRRNSMPPGPICLPGADSVTLKDIQSMDAKNPEHASFAMPVTNWDITPLNALMLNKRL